MIAAEQLLNASYTRGAETAADRFAFDLLDGANVDVSAFAGFFEKIGQQAGEPSAIMEHFAPIPIWICARNRRAIMGIQVRSAPC